MCGPADFDALALSMTRVGYTLLFIAGIAVASRLRAHAGSSLRSPVGRLWEAIRAIPIRF